MSLHIKIRQMLLQRHQTLAGTGSQALLSCCALQGQENALIKLTDPSVGLDQPAKFCFI